MIMWANIADTNTMQLMADSGTDVGMLTVKYLVTGRVIIKAK